MDKTTVIFGNKIDQKTVKKAEKSKQSYIKQFGDDSSADYKLSFKPIDTLAHIGAQNIVFGEENAKFEGNPLIIGNIRMGFGHYRISIAMASCARALGYTPYWLDLASFDATGSKMIRKQNDMYSLASRISQKSRLFNKLVWEPLNSEGFKKITYNAVDQKNSELLVPIFKNIDKDIPYIATHVWPSQAAVHAGMKNVVNAIPDNWPMGLHLSEGAIHTVQTPFAYLGYKTLSGFAKTELKGIPEEYLKDVGCYVDHELLCNLEQDNELRRKRVTENAPIRLLMNVGGAGAGGKMFEEMIDHLIPYINDQKVALFLNTGDHKGVFDMLNSHIADKCEKHLFCDQYGDFTRFVKNMRNSKTTGITLVYNQDIFPAVYSANLLMPECDMLITKPSELAYYPIPKMYMKHIGGHEVYGAIHGREFGDSTDEYPTTKSICAAIDRILNDKEIILHLIDRIDELKAAGYYNGAYECVRLATQSK